MVLIQEVCEKLKLTEPQLKDWLISQEKLFELDLKIDKIALQESYDKYETYMICLQTIADFKAKYNLK